MHYNIPTYLLLLLVVLLLLIYINWVLSPELLKVKPCVPKTERIGNTVAGVFTDLRANYKKILRLSYDVIITYDNRKSNLR